MLDTKQETIKRSTFGTRFFVKKKIDMVERGINQSGERLKGVIAPYDKQDEFLFITNRSIIHHKVKNSISVVENQIPLGAITHVKMKQKGLVVDLVFSSNSGSIEIEKVPMDLAIQAKNIIEDLA